MAQCSVAVTIQLCAIPLANTFINVTKIFFMILQTEKQLFYRSCPFI